MNNIKKSAQAGFYSLLMFMILLVAGGIDSSFAEEPEPTDCDDRENRRDTYTALVVFAGSCPVGVTFAYGENGCDSPSIKNDLQPPVCVCADKNESVQWESVGASPDVDFTVHFSPFGHGSVRSNNGRIPPQVVPRFGNRQSADRVVFKYSITAGDECPVLDPPFIIKQ